MWLHERQRIRKSTKIIDEDLNNELTNIWKESVFDLCVKWPQHMNEVSLASFVTCFYKDEKGEYKGRAKPKVIRYQNYNVQSEPDEHEREMVLLHVPHRDEHEEFLKDSKYQQIYNERLQYIHEACK